MRLAVTDLDGNVAEVRSTSSDLVAWEAYARKNGLPLQVKVTRTAGGAPVVDVERFPLHTFHAFLAHRATHRGQGEPPTLEAWLDTVESVEPADDEADAPTPTPAAP